MAPCRKIRFIRNQLLYVGDITVSVKDSTGEYKPIQIDRSKATSSSWMRYCDVKDGWGGCKSFTNYRATDNPSVTWTSDGIWTIDLGKTYDNIYVKAKTNADKIQLLAENDSILEEHSLFVGNKVPYTTSNPKDWNIPSREYYGETIGDIISIPCINDKYWAGNIQKCTKGTNPNGCSGFVYTGRNYNTQAPFYKYADMFPGFYSIVNEQRCNLNTLPNGIKVGDKTQNWCEETYNICEGDNCMKRLDGSLYYKQNIVGCMDGKLSDWSDWSCIDGNATKTRTCIPPLNGGKPCPNDPLIENAVCKDAKVGDWGNWSKCDGSTIKRTRTCLEPPTNGGAPCPADEVKKCSDGKILDWSPWKCDGVLSSRTRKCLPPQNGGKPCPDVPLIESKACSHGKLSEWSDWSCIDGNATRTRVCIPPQNGGKPCPDAPLIESKTCSDGKLSEWSDWWCDGEFSSRTRVCFPPQNGGEPCPDVPLIESKTCSDGKLSEWSNWSCIDGNATRTRTCIPPVNDGIPCPDLPLIESKTCSDGKLSEWSNWSDCDGEFSSRTRTCNPPLNGGKPCPDLPLIESKTCSDFGFLTFPIILFLILLFSIICTFSIIYIVRKKL
jgi:hypothetical protein